MTAYIAIFMAPFLLWPLRSKSRVGYVFLLAAIWALFAGLRIDIGGKDFFAYRNFYLALHALNVKAHHAAALRTIARYRSWEPLFRWLAMLCNTVGLSFHEYLSLVSLLGILPAVFVLDRLSKKSPIALFVYGIEFMLYGSFVILREGISIGLAFLVVDSLREKRVWTAVIACLLAVGFHYSAIVLVLFFLFSHRLSPKVRSVAWFAAGAAGLAFCAFIVLGHGRALAGIPLAQRLLRYIPRLGTMSLNPLNVLEVLAISFLLFRYTTGVPAILENGFLAFMALTLFATIQAIFVRMGSYFKIVIPMVMTFISRPMKETVIEARLGPAAVELVIVVYYLAKITRWLLLNAGGHGGFLPYKTIFG